MESPTIHFVPMEPYPERYTSQWTRWWPRALADATRRHGARHTLIEGVLLSPTIRTGAMFDGVGTCYWKATQLCGLIEAVERGAVADGDIIFLADVWLPGLEMLDYIRRVAGKRYTIAGILHAGSYLPGDYTHDYGIAAWARHSEHAWAEVLDAVFVATHYHAEQVRVALPGLERKLHVEGLPFEPDEVWDGATVLQKENLIVFPHGRGDTKGYPEFTRFRERMEPRLPGWRWVVSRDESSNRDEYYALLRRSKIALSFAQQETFGYSMIEAAAAGCHVLAPRRLSYPEIFPPDMLWEDEAELEEKLFLAISGGGAGSREVAERYRTSADRILDRLLATGRESRVRGVG